MRQIRMRGFATKSPVNQNIAAYRDWHVREKQNSAAPEERPRIMTGDLLPHRGEGVDHIEPFFGIVSRRPRLVSFSLLESGRALARMRFSPAGVAQAWSACP